MGVTDVNVQLFQEHLFQPCQNVPAASNFAAFSPFLAAYSTLDFTMSPLAGKGTWFLLPTTPSMLPTATKHFDRAAYLITDSMHIHYFLPIL